jgi:hypothetical protein
MLNLPWDVYCLLLLQTIENKTHINSTFGYEIGN